MNVLDRGARGQATLRYLDGEFAVITPGSYVLCAVTGVQIPLDQLRYWSVDLQEAYADANAANRRHAELLKRGGGA